MGVLSLEVDSTDVIEASYSPLMSYIGFLDLNCMKMVIFFNHRCT